MPDLPTLTVTSAQATRIQAAFGGVEQYKAWLRQAVKQYVVLKEREALVAEFEVKVGQSASAVETELGTI